MFKTLRDYFFPPKKSERCLVGVGVIIVHQGRMLVGIRKGSHCAGFLAFPGGHVDLDDDSLEVAASREPEEEVLDPRTGKGLKVKIHTMGRGRPQVFLRHDHMEGKSKAYVTLFMKGTLADPEGINVAENMPSPPEEQHKCDHWEWLTFNELVHRILGVQSYTWTDLTKESDEIKAWIPLDLIQAHAHELGIRIT
jgi:8-oxo-dGTP diphosphatase